jgi:hypothetical protein
MDKPSEDFDSPACAAYRAGSRILGAVLAAAGVVLAVPWTQVVSRAASSRGSTGPLISFAPPGWLSALAMGLIGLVVVGGLVAVGVGALRLRPWASRAALVLGLIGLGLAAPVYCATVLYSEPPPVVVLVSPPLAIALLSGANLWLLRRGCGR